MPDRESREVPADKRTAAHGGEGGAERDTARPEPGSGLDRRQGRNSDATEAADDGQGAHSGRTDSKNP